jgi:SPP1 family predicted phage head-tail adaptor
MSFDAGRLRHRIDIQEKKSRQDGASGAMRVKWRTVFADVPAEIVPASVRDFVASQAQQSEIVARITIRFRDGLRNDMRIVHRARNRIYNPADWLADPDSGMEYVTAPCSSGVNDGE